jgi:hypothetical protein
MSSIHNADPVSHDLASFRLASVKLASALPAAALAFGVMLASGTATPAAAQNTSAEQACQPDAFRLCEAFVPDRGKVGACLRRNKRQLSAECRVFFSSRKLRRR